MSNQIEIYSHDNSIEKNQIPDSKLLRDYLLKIRQIIQTNNRIHLADHDDLKKILYEECSSIIFDDTNDIFEYAINIIVNECISLDKNKNYLVDNSTGLVVLPVNNDTIITSIHKDGESGELKKTSILNPGYSASIGLLTQDRNNKKQILEKYPGSTTEHISDPLSIVRVAIEILAKNGITVDNCNGIAKTIIIGKENIHELLQSPNPSFHRFRLFGELLAKKIMGLNTKKCYINAPVLCKSAKYQWYTIDVLMPQEVD